MLSTIIFLECNYSALPKRQQIHQGFKNVVPRVPNVTFLLFTIITVDRDQTVSQRSKPNSGTILMDEQSNPWNRLQLQDIISRHRGLKLLHR